MMEKIEMKYERTKIIGGLNMFPGMELYMKPELPKIKFKKGRTTYEFTDLRCLNEAAVSLFFDIVGTVCNTENCKEVSYDVTELKEDRRHLYADILAGIEYRCKSRKHDTQGSFLCIGTRVHTDENGVIVQTFELIEENAKAIYDYAQSHKNEGVIEFHDLVFAVIEERIKRFENFCKIPTVHLDEEVFPISIGNKVEA